MLSKNNMDWTFIEEENKKLSDVSNGFISNMYISDELEEQKIYSPEQLKKMWENAYPIISEINNNIIITGSL